MSSQYGRWCCRWLLGLRLGIGLLWGCLGSGSWWPDVEKMRLGSSWSTTKKQRCFAHFDTTKSVAVTNVAFATIAISSLRSITAPVAAFTVTTWELAVAWCRGSCSMSGKISIAAFLYGTLSLGSLGYRFRWVFSWRSCNLWRILE